MTSPADLPYVDMHATTVAASPEVVGQALRDYVARVLDLGERTPFTRLLGAEPRAGFTIAEDVLGERLTLVGRHRFADYRLEFEIVEGLQGDSQLRALTYAAFRGLPGRAYRTAVIGSRLHVLVTRRMLASVRRRAGQAS